MDLSLNLRKPQVKARQRQLAKSLARRIKEKLEAFEDENFAAYSIWVQPYSLLPIHDVGFEVRVARDSEREHLRYRVFGKQPNSNCFWWEAYEPPEELGDGHSRLTTNPLATLEDVATFVVKLLTPACDNRMGDDSDDAPDKPDVYVAPCWDADDHLG